MKIPRLGLQQYSTRPALRYRIILSWNSEYFVQHLEGHVRARLAMMAISDRTRGAMEEIHRGSVCTYECTLVKRQAWPFPHLQPNLTSSQQDRTSIDGPGGPKGVTLMRWNELADIFNGDDGWDQAILDQMNTLVESDHRVAAITCVPRPSSAFSGTKLRDSWSVNRMACRFKLH